MLPPLEWARSFPLGSCQVLEQLLLFTTSGALAKLPNFSKLQCLHLGKPQSQGLSFPCLGSWHASQRKRWVCVLPPSSPPILLLFAMQQTGLAGQAFKFVKRLKSLACPEMWSRWNIELRLTEGTRNRPLDHTVQGCSIVRVSCPLT